MLINAAKTQAAHLKSFTFHIGVAFERGDFNNFKGDSNNVYSIKACISNGESKFPKSVYIGIMIGCYLAVLFNGIIVTLIIINAFY